MDHRQTSSSRSHRTLGTLHEQRHRLFNAVAILHVCRHACASQLEGFDAEQLAMALDVVDDLVTDAAGALEQFAGEEVTASD